MVQNGYSVATVLLLALSWLGLYLFVFLDNQIEIACSQDAGKLDLEQQLLGTQQKM